MITLRYLGKKDNFTLNLPFLSRPYYVAGPDAVIDFTNSDATQMMATNPKMFRVEGIKKDPEDLEQETALEVPSIIIPATEVKQLDPLPDKWDKVPADAQAEPLVLTGDGVDGDADEVPISVLMTYTADELRIYAMQRFGHQFTEDDKRNPMVKKIKELEMKKSQADK